MAERINTSGASAKEIAQAIKEVLTESNEMSKTTLKIKTDSSIYKARDGIEGLTEALEAYEKYINKNKTNHSKSAYFTTEEQAINRLKNAWNEYAKERNSGIVNDDNLAKSDTAKKVLALANALEAITGRSSSISEVSDEIANLVSHMREMSNFKNYNLDASQFKEIFSLLSKIQDLYPDISEIVKPFKGTEEPIETLIKLTNSAGAASSSASSEASDGYNEQGKAAEEAAKKIEKLTEAEMERKLKSEHKKGKVDEWDLYLDDDLNDLQKYSKKLDDLKESLSNSLRMIVYYNNKLADGKTVSKYGTDYQENLDYNVKEYHKYIDQIEYIQEKLQDAVKTYKPDAKGDNAEELNSLVLILRSLYEEITKISSAFSNIDENSGIGNLINSIGKINDSLTLTLSKISELSEVISNKDFNLIFNNKSSSNGNPMASNLLYGMDMRSIIRQMKNEKAELDSFFRDYYNKKGRSNISSSQALGQLFSGKELGIINSYSDLVDIPNKFSSALLDSSEKGKGNLQEIFNLLQEYFDLVERASKAKGIDISSITSKYNNNFEEQMRSATRVITGDLEQAQETENVFKNFLKGANNIDLTGITLELSKLIEPLERIEILIREGFTVNDILNGKPVDTGDEVKGLTAVKESVEDITRSVNKKTEAFKQEEATIAKIVPNETNYLGKLISALKIINENLDEIAKFSGLDLSKIKIPEVKEGKIASGATNVSGDPKEAKKRKERTATKADDGMTADQIEARTKSLTEATDRLERDLTESGSVVKEVVEFYDSQDNLVKTVLKEEKELDGTLKKTTWTTNYDKNGEESFSSHIDTYDYDKIRKQEIAEEKRLEQERLNQAKRIANEEKNTKSKLSQESYNQEKKWLKEIYALKEKNAQAVENNSPTQERDIAYNNALIESYKELIADEKEYRKEKGLSDDNRNQDYELSLLSQYEAKRDAYNQSLQETIRLAQQEAELESEKRNNSTKSEAKAKREKDVNDLLSRQQTEYENIYKTILSMAKLDSENDKDKIAELKRQGEQYTRNYNALERELETYKDIVDQTKKENELLSIKIKYQNQINNEKADKRDKNRNNSKRKSETEESKEVQRIAKQQASEYEKREKEYLEKRNRLLEEGNEQAQEYNKQRQDYEKFWQKSLENQEISDRKNEKKAADKANEKAAKAYKDLYKDAKDYYTLLEKEKSGNLLGEEIEELKRLKKEWQEALEAKGKYAKNDSGNTDDWKTANEDFIKNNTLAYKDNIKNFADDMQDQLNRINVNKKNFKYIDSYYSLTDSLQSKINELNNKPLDIIEQSEIEDVAKLRNEIEDLLSKIKEQTKNKDFLLADSEEAYKKMTDISKLLRDNTKMPSSLKEQFRSLQNDYEIAIKTRKSQAELEELNKKLEELKFKLADSGKTGDSVFVTLGKRIKNMSTNFIAMYFSLYDIYRYISEGVRTVRELDTAFTEMRKVSDESVESLRRFQDASFDLANSVGTTASQIQNSTADFMRLGESLDQATESAQQANILLNVSEFESIDEATESLVAMSAAYDELEKAEIVDIMNNIGNNYAISTDELASALQRSAATLKVAGNDIYEATALVTAGNAVLQDAESVGTGLKMISLRILGTEEAKDELASLGEDVDDFVVQTQSKIDETVREYTAVASNDFKGVSILDDNGNYRSTYEILRDISEVYQEILETDKKAGTNRGQALLEVLAGFRSLEIWKHISKNIFNCKVNLKLYATI